MSIHPGVNASTLGMAATGQPMDLQDINSLPPWGSGDARRHMEPVLEDRDQTTFQGYQSMPGNAGSVAESHQSHATSHFTQPLLYEYRTQNPLQTHNPYASITSGTPTTPSHIQRQNPMVSQGPSVQGHHHSSDSRSMTLPQNAMVSADTWNTNNRPRGGSIPQTIYQGSNYGRGSTKSQRGGRKDANHHSSASGGSRQGSGARAEPQLSSKCPNVSGDSPYVSCDCAICNSRNRSIYVKIRDTPVDNTSVMDIQTRVKHGLTDRIGPVEEVIHTSSRPEQMAFLVR